MTAFRKIAKCPNCLPDSKGAIFRKQMGNDGWEWKCNNCHYTCPARINKPEPKITPSQQEVIDRIKAYGWEVETKFIGRDVWITGSKDYGNVGLNLFKGDSFFGKIGPRGSFKLTLQCIGKQPELTTFSALSVYLA